MESFVDKILNKPTFEDMLVSFLKPQITNLAILSPGIYNQLGPELQAIITKLLKDANDKKDNKKKKKFKAAQEILEEEGELRDLLTTYIHTLHQA